MIRVCKNPAAQRELGITLKGVSGIRFQVNNLGAGMYETVAIRKEDRAELARITEKKAHVLRRWYAN